MFGLFGSTDSKHLRRIWTATKFAGNSSAADDKNNSWNMLFEKYQIDFSDEQLRPEKLEPLIEAIIEFDEKNPRNGGVLVTSAFLSELIFRSMDFSNEKRAEFDAHFKNYFAKKGF